MVRNFKRTKGEARWIGPFVVLRTTVKGVEIKSEHGNSRLLTVADVKLSDNPINSSGRNLWELIKLLTCCLEIHLGTIPRKHDPEG